MRLSYVFAALMLLLFSFPTQAQMLSSVFPPSGSPDPSRTLDVEINGIGTNFTAGVSKADFGEGISVLYNIVRNKESMKATIRIESGAAPGLRTVKVVTGSEVAIKDQAFTIIATGNSQVTVTMEVNPTQSIKLTDFDPEHPENAPVLFTVNIYNDQKQRDLGARVIVSGQTYGALGTGTKEYNGVLPSAQKRFNNRQFDRFEKQANSGFFIQSALQTGILPADIYSYKVEVYDKSDPNTVLAQAIGINPISLVQKPELIGPGNSFSLYPEPISNKSPLFQWFSQATQYDFYVYEVLEGQRSAAEVALNRPVYKQTGVFQTSLVYPVSAAILQEGKTYAWQVKAHFNTSNGAQLLESDLFWFKIQSSGKPEYPISEIKVQPQQITLTGGQVYLFKAQALNTRGEEVSIKPQWKVVPSDAGTIDANGNFTAGKTGQAAIIATYGDQQDYASVNIAQIVNSGGEEWLVNMFLRKVFGLPEK